MFFSLRNRLFIIFTLLLTIPFLVLSIIIPNWFTSIFEEQTKNSTVEMMDQYSLYIDSITSQAEDLGKQVLVNQATQQWLKSEKDNTEIKSAQDLLKNQLKMQLSSMMINNSKSMSISVFLIDGTGTWEDLPTIQETEWFKNFTENDQRWVKTHDEAIAANVNSYLLPLFDLYTLDLSGVIKVNFPSSLLETALSKIKLGENGRVYLVDSSGDNVLSGEVQTPEYVLNKSLEEIWNDKQNKGLIETNYNGDEYLVFYQKLKIGDWVLVSEITKSELFSKINTLQKNLLLTSVLIFFLTIIASYFLSSTIVRPLGKLTKAMKFVERGDFSRAKDFMLRIKSYNDEVGYAIKVFDHTIDKLNFLIRTEYEANIRRKDAEYKALLLQINPHFLNNTLEIIGGLAAQGKNKEVMNVSIHLGRMMRYSLNTQSDIVKLGEEIAYIRDFTDILKLRYEDAITVEIEEDPETKFVPIIKFIIQPLVENAVKYSFINKQFAQLKIKTENCGDEIFIIVEDYGIGMTEEVVTNLLDTELNNESSNVLKSKGSSIGLENVLGRLKLYYGENFSYNIQSEKDKGTKITLCIRLFS
ncbi:two-component system sensor histidine kinase YesM [Metabacillus crassostreae]|uniref:sensor histidine kinase n=1 Tax=Metabacillus crassostreae TaxID=929098 RepID=UPI001956175F|nr:sensor histidine kinase [Metabacillus crassostreae]MBM7603958.1 two-component system sensor histidine kinase YesM [Metabacillus crassostreae]